MISDRSIKKLQEEAALHDDDMQWLVCERALHDDFNAENYTGGGHRVSPRQWRTLHDLTQEEARLMCRAALDAARARA